MVVRLNDHADVTWSSPTTLRIAAATYPLTVMARRGHVVHAWSDREAPGSWGLHATLCGFAIDPTTGWGLRPTRGVIDCRRCIRLLTVA
jgi:hypothetical protein